MPLERRPRTPCVPVFPCFWILMAVVFSCRIRNPDGHSQPTMRMDGQRRRVQDPKDRSRNESLVATAATPWPAANTESADASAPEARGTDAWAAPSSPAPEAYLDYAAAAFNLRRPAK